ELDFSGEAQLLRRCVLGTARLRFVMPQLSEWGPDKQLAALPNLQTQIDIVESDAKALIESLDRVEDVLPQHQTRSRDGRHVLGDEKAIAIALMIAGEAAIEMPRHAAHADDDA